MAPVPAEAHHAAPRCLIALHERANGARLDGEGIQAWVEWEIEAMRWRVPVEISRADLEELVERSARTLEREKHRLTHLRGVRGGGRGVMANHFELGVVCATPGAIVALGPALIAEVLARHASGDWGDLGTFDRRENERAVREGLRVISAYETPAGRAWVITEADRSSTTVLLPGEY